MGDERAYQCPIILRAIESSDAMMVDWVKLPYEVLAKMPPLHPDDGSPASRVYKLKPSMPLAHYQMTQEEVLKANKEMLGSFER